MAIRLHLMFATSVLAGAASLAGAAPAPSTSPSTLEDRVDRLERELAALRAQCGRPQASTSHTTSPTTSPTPTSRPATTSTGPTRPSSMPRGTPKTAAELVQQAQQALFDGDAEQARALAQRAVGLAFGDRTLANDARVIYATALFELRDYRRALTFAETLLRSTTLSSSQRHAIERVKIESEKAL